MILGLLDARRVVFGDNWFWVHRTMGGTAARLVSAWYCLVFKGDEYQCAITPLFRRNPTQRNFGGVMRVATSVVKE